MSTNDAKLRAERERAEKLARLEKQRAKQWEAEQQQTLEARANQVKELTALATKQLEDAQRLHVGAVELGNAAVMAKAAKDKEKQDIFDEHHQHRTEVVIALKEHSDLAHGEVIISADKNVRKKKAALKKLEEDKDSMLSRGLNPYAEFRKKEVDDEADAKLRKLKNDVKSSKANLAVTMAKEEKIRQKTEAKVKADLDYEQAARDEQARLVIENRVSKYISKVTGGRDLIDPTGRAPPSDVQPSQLVEVPDFTFGSGKSARIPETSMKRITERIRAELRVDREDLGEYKRLVAGLLAETGKEGSATLQGRKVKGSELSSGDAYGDDDSDNEAGGGAAPAAAETMMGADLTAEEVMAARAEQERRLEELQTMASLLGAVPGAEGAAVDVNMGWDDDVDGEVEAETLLKLAQEEPAGAGHDDGRKVVETIAKYPIPPLTKHENDLFERAKGRQTGRIKDGVPQIAVGRVYTGPAFIPKPAEIIFLDFEVGKRYKKRFTLTNASYTFNSFKLLDLPDEVVDFFTITYERPGRMSAGVSCFIDIEFVPKVNADIYTAIPFYSQTGPGAVPLKCLIRRCAPRVESTMIDFGKMTVGQKAVLPLRINNTQILPTGFTVMRVLPVDRRRAPGTGEEEDDDATLMSEEKDVAMDGLVAEGAESVRPFGVSEEKLPEGIPEGADDGAGAGAAAAAGTLDLAAAYRGVDTMRDELMTRLLAAATVRVEPAANDGELTARVSRVMTATMRKKISQFPYPLSVNAAGQSKETVNGQHFVMMKKQRDGMMTGDDADNFDLHPDIGNRGDVDGYGGVTLDVLCAPLSIGAIECQFAVTFDQVENEHRSVDGQGRLVTKEQLFTCRVEVDELPVYPVYETLDLKTVLFGRIYRKHLDLANRSKTACKVTIKIPPLFARYVSVNPQMLFVQAGTTQTVNLKFEPIPNIVKKLAYFSVPFPAFANAAALQIPIEVQMANQELPVFFILKTIVCQSTIDMSAESLDFGRVYVGQRNSLPLTVKNTSMLPQKVAFVRMKKEVTVHPYDGFATLLPNESVTFEVSFSPTSVVGYDFELTLLTSANDKCPVRITGHGIEPPVMLSNAVLHLRTTAPGERVLQSIEIVNTTHKRQVVEAMLPSPLFSWIKIAPSIVDLAPQQRQRVEIEYLPPPGLTAVDPLEWLAQATQTADALHAESTLVDDASAEAKAEPSVSVAAGSVAAGSAASAASAAAASAAAASAASAASAAAAGSTGGGAAAAAAPGPAHGGYGAFTAWEEDGGWVYARSEFGEIQWVKPRMLPGLGEGEDGGESVLSSLAEASSMLDVSGAEGEPIPAVPAVADAETDADAGVGGAAADGGDGAGAGALRGEGSDEVPASAQDTHKISKHVRIDEAALRAQEEEEAAAQRARDARRQREQEDLELRSDVPAREWGIAGTWRIPICVKPKASNVAAEALAALAAAGAKGPTGGAGEAAGEEKDGAVAPSSSSSSKAPPPPLFLCINTMCMLPQVDADTKVVDFGQMAVGIRMVKVVTISNLGFAAVSLKSEGISAVGPFAMLNPVKTLQAGEFKKVAIECCPSIAGLFVEILELRCPDSVGGHRIRIALRAQGVMPSVSIEGLLPPPANWGLRANQAGILDFGNVLVNDVATQIFTVSNDSTFPVNVTMMRAVAVGLKPYEMIDEVADRAATGLPIFTFRPEKVRLQPGGHQKVEVSFRPDRYRFYPFREELQIEKTSTSYREILRVGLCGRSRDRQMYVAPARPIDERWAQNLCVNTDNLTGVAYRPGQNIIGQGILSVVDDPVAASQLADVKKAAAEALKYAHSALPPPPAIKLEFPDPFAPDAVPGTYTEVAPGAAAAAAGGKGAKGAPAAAAAAGPADGAAPSRQQTRRLLISSILPSDNRPGSAPGTFEFVLGKEAKESGLWALAAGALAAAGGSPKKGAAPGGAAPLAAGASTGSVPPGQQFAVDISCTLPAPKGVGGLSVGSWQVYPCEVVLKGGWAPPGDADEARVPVLLKAYVSL